jgi:hypothetical protein
LESALAVERELQQRLFASEDAKEGLNAYVEKRPATFKAKWRRLAGLSEAGARCRHPERSEGSRECVQYVCDAKRSHDIVSREFPESP